MRCSCAKLSCSGLAVLVRGTAHLRPVLFAVNLGQRSLVELAGRAVENDQARAQADDALGEALGQDHVVNVDDRR